MRPELIVGVLFTALLVALYLIPTRIAYVRKHRNRQAIAAVNVLFGWTILGWGLALVWAMTADVESPALVSMPRRDE